MTSSFSDRDSSNPSARSARRYHQVFSSVLLALGAAALIGWLVAEFYVTAVTAD
jgi:hypothetical protein